jgi:outer membrane immunogenic protein
MRLGAVVAALAAALYASVLGAPTAKAADMTPILKGPAGSGYIPAQFSWTGFYLGLASGGGIGTANFTDPFPNAGGVASSAKLSGFLVGGVTGINYQIGSLVVGFEGDFIGSWAKGSVVDTAGTTLTNEVMWTSTVAARLGWAWDRWMIYAKGGGAFDNDRSTAAIGTSGPIMGTTFVATGGSNMGGTLRAGWNVGGGVEWAVTEHWIARFAYDYLKFSGKIITFDGNAILAPDSNLLGRLTALPVNGGVGVSLSEFKAVIEYKF